MAKRFLMHAFCFAALLLVAAVSEASFAQRHSTSAISLREMKATGLPLADNTRVEQLLREGEELWNQAAYKPALEKLETALKLIDPLSEPQLAARCLNLMGNVSASDGDYAKGIERHQRALDLAKQTGDQKLIASVLSDTGLGYWRQANYTMALDYCQQALAIQKQLGALVDQAKTLIYVGRIYFKQGEYEQALAALNEALELQQRSESLAAQSVTQEDIGDVYQEQGSFAQALQHYQKSLRLRQQIGDTGGECYMLHIIGKSYMLQGAYSEAQVWYRRSLEMAQKNNDRSGYAEAFYHLGLTHMRQGNYDQALKCYHRAQLAFEKLGNRRQEAWVIGFAGEAHYLRGEFTQAVQFYERSINLFQEIGDRRGVDTGLTKLGRLYYDLGDDRRALEYYERDARLQEETPIPFLSKTLVAIGRIHARRGDLLLALRFGHRGVESARGTGNPELEWAAWYGLGTIQRQSGLREEALQSLLESLSIIEKLRANLAAADEAKVGFLEGKQTVYADTISLLLELGRDSEALELAERARARAFLDLLGARELEAKQADTAAMTRIRLLQRELQNSVANPNAASATTRNRMRGHDLIQLELRKLQHEQPELASLVSIQPSALPELQAAARERKSVIVEYFSANERLFIWAVDPAGSVHATSISLQRRELEQLAQQMRREMIDSSTQRRTQFVSVNDRIRKKSGGGALPEKLSPSRRLFRALIEPVAKWLPRDPNQLVTIIPHGPLFLISFAALPDADGRYLIERHTINYSPSISLLRFTEIKERRARERDAAHLLLVGNPANPKSLGKRLLPSLPGAESEAWAISRQYPARQVTALVGVQAEERLVRTLAPGQSIIHMATHGIIRDDEPLESFLVLSPRPERQTEDSDGRLTVREIFQLELNADLVVLSACNTGLGRINGDGVIGLSRAFVYAGTPSVIVSLWRVADPVAKFQMERFHIELKRNGYEKAVALRQAQLETLNLLRRRRLRTPSGTVLREQPVYWAPFVLIGEAH